MPHFETTLTLIRPIADVFAFLADPANLIAVSPPEFHLRLVEGPERLRLGARVTVQGRRWGVAQRITSEVAVFEPPHLLVDEQCQGPFKSFVHTHRLEAVPEGTRMTDHIDFEAPGGMLGLILTERRILQELHEVFAHRDKKFKELLEKPKEAS
jgi:ligand-binding SRPBCC domain-containing protein